LHAATFSKLAEAEDKISWKTQEVRGYIIILLGGIWNTMPCTSAMNMTRNLAPDTPGEFRGATVFARLFDIPSK
jgi:hypothetical protein